MPMYSYEWDEETGGYLLNSTPLAFSKEPRPVYYREMDLLGFDKYWNYEKDDTYPYMWAEANKYWYRGQLIAQTKGGSLSQPPKLLPSDDQVDKFRCLRQVDVPAMVERNRSNLNGLVQDTIKNLYNTYMKMRSKVDVFYVAFSGGKDSVVTLDIVQHALPHNSFIVLFGDTQMEFPDTYDTVNKIEKICQGQKIEFYKSKADTTPECTWAQFGPPATTNRWCCSVLKTSPQIRKLREITGKHNFTGLAFIGVRASESLARSEYDYISLGEKHKGQYSCNPILEWNSAEIFLYIYTEKLILNEAYKKGNRRAGCLVCPRASERNDYMSRTWYRDEFDYLMSLIREQYKITFPKGNDLDTFLANGGWKARKNGRDIQGLRRISYTEIVSKDSLTIRISHSKTNWKVWINTIGILYGEKSPYTIMFRGETFQFSVHDTETGYDVSIDATLQKSRPLFIKLFKNVFRKAACCVACKECEADCHNGCLHFIGGQPNISAGCVHCAQCHKAEKGCLVYKSLEMPRGGTSMQNTSLNSYSHHAPKKEWLEQFFNYGEYFDQKNTLGSQMYSFFKRFLRDANLINDGGITKFANLINKMGLDNMSAWALILVNLSYTPQVGWFVKSFDFGERVEKEYFISIAINSGAKESWVGDVWNSIGRLIDLPFGKLGLGFAERPKRNLTAITRTVWEDPDPLVILYSLYKFAKACEDYFQFTLTTLMDNTIERGGISPTEIFGLSAETMEKLLNGLSINYPEFINCSFKMDLDSITLRTNKTPDDVLALFE